MAFIPSSYNYDRESTMAPVKKDLKNSEIKDYKFDSLVVPD